MSDSEIIVPREKLKNALRTLEIAEKGKSLQDLIILGKHRLLILKVGGAKIEISGDEHIVGQARLSGKICIKARVGCPG